MTRETELTFECLFLLEDIRELWRETSPKHGLSADQKKKLNEITEKVKKKLDEIVKIKGK